MKKLCIFILLVNSFALFPCSIFTYVDGSDIYFCGNEDWMYKNPSLLCVPSEEDEYGVLLLGWDTLLPSYPQAGVNSFGLCFDWASVPAQKYTLEKDKQYLNSNDTIRILKKCRTVDEAVDFIKKANFPHIAEEHIMFADRSGNSCVIEFTKGELKVIKSSCTQYITNFNITGKEAGWYPCSRYETLSRMLCNTGLKHQNLVNVLDAVHQEGEYPTVYSYIMNLSKMTITLFYNHDYSKSKEYSIAALIRNREKITIE